MIIVYIISGAFAILWITVFIKIVVSIFKNIIKTMRGLKDNQENSTNKQDVQNSAALTAQVFCEYCGSKITEQEAKCKHCGAPITK